MIVFPPLPSYLTTIPQVTIPRKISKRQMLITMCNVLHFVCSLMKILQNVMHLKKVFLSQEEAILNMNMSKYLKKK